jgi:hypothetical protein
VRGEPNRALELTDGSERGLSRQARRDVRAEQHDLDEALHDPLLLRAERHDLDDAGVAHRTRDHERGDDQLRTGAGDVHPRGEHRRLAKAGEVDPEHEHQRRRREHPEVRDRRGHANGGDVPAEQRRRLAKLHRIARARVEEQDRDEGEADR